MLIEPIIREAIAYAGLITLGSIGITMTFLTSKVPNFAQGSFILVGSYTTLTVAAVFGLPPYSAIPLAAIIGGLLGFSAYNFVLKPAIARGVKAHVLTVLTLAIDLLFFGFFGGFADYLQVTYRVPSRFFYLRYLDFQFAGIYGAFWVSILLVVSITIGLYLLLTKTNFGIAIRATVENPQLASVIGINTERVTSFSWFISGGLATVAGCMLPFLFSVGPYTSVIIIITLFAGSVVGGLSNIYGAVVGGYFIGFTEVFGTGLLTNTFGSWVTAYQPAIPLLIMIAVLLVVPKGIMGVHWRNRIRLRR